MNHPATPRIPRNDEIPAGWEGLAMAVILQACDDYRSALRTCRRQPDSKRAAAARRQLERFFVSRWFRALTDLDGGILLKRLKEESK